VDDPARAAAALDGRRLLGNLGSLAQIGRTAQGGVSRTAFSEDFVAGRSLVADACRAAGLASHVDEVGNLVCETDRERSSPPAIIVGSHLDTVANAGLLDGAYGVLGGLAAIDAITSASIRLRHPVVLAGFVNEEGAGGTAAMLGSKACAGRSVESDLHERDESGRSVAELVVGIGGRPDDAPSAALGRRGPLGAYLELHVEQGPVLERSGRDIGIVTGITGRVLVDVTCMGRAVHAGTTPMEAREDALVAAALVVGAVERTARRGLVRVATAGALRVEPGVRNTVPGRVILEAELRDADRTAMSRGLDALDAAVAEISASTGVRIETRVVEVVEPCATDAMVRGALAAGALACGASCAEITSGAGHDAQSFAGVVPIGMCFVPSIEGVSHAPAEATRDEDLVRGAAVLAASIVVLDRTLVASPDGST